MKLLLWHGFCKTLVHDHVAGVDAVMFSRVCGGTRETVLAYSEAEAVAYRVHTRDIDPADPFTVDPDHALWQRGGAFLDVAGQLLRLRTREGGCRT